MTPQEAEAVRLLYDHKIILPPVDGGPSPYLKARILLGTPKEDLAPQLTREEIDRWLEQSDHEHPLDWLWSVMVERFPELKEARRPRLGAHIRAMTQEVERRAWLMEEVLTGEATT